MSKVNYFTPSELMSKARDVMVPLENQIPAQQKIATIIGMHLARIQALNRGASPNEIISVSAFLVGATGSGKSYIIKSLADVCGLHFRQIDCASITQAGVRGKNIAHVLDQIICEDPAFFEGGILNLDEVDKIFYKNDPHYDAYSPQQDFLKLLEGGDYTFSVDNRTETINLNRTLILLSGACANIAENLKKKYCTRVAIGFSSDTKVQTENEDYASLITLDDLIGYGMMPELASRVNTVIHIPKIDVHGYRMLATADAKSSSVNRFKTQFAMRGVQLAVSDEAVNAIAAECVARDVGARSVQAILNEQLLDAYRIADDKMDCNTVQLYVNNAGCLDVEYQTGPRIQPPMFNNRRLETPNFSVLAECECDDAINHFADEMVEASLLDNVADERLVYYFLQTVCRFLRDEVRSDECTFSSILKLANTTEVNPSNPICKTTYDIILEDYAAKLENADGSREENSIKHAVFCHYYNAFKTENHQRSHAHAILVKALKSAGHLYCPIEQRSMRTQTR